MKRTPKETLLHDVLREASDGFRQEVFEASVKELRQRRGRTKIWRLLPLAIAASFILSAGLLFFSMAHHTKRDDRARVPNNSQTAPVSAYAEMEIVTNSRSGIAIVESSQYAAIVVDNSTIREPVEVLGDTEFLALFPDKPAGLIANSQGRVQLVLLDSTDGVFRQ